MNAPISEYITYKRQRPTSGCKNQPAMPRGFQESLSFCESRASRLGLPISCGFNIEQASRGADEKGYGSDRVLFCIGVPPKDHSTPTVSLIHCYAKNKKAMWEYCKKQGAEPQEPYTFDANLFAMCVHIDHQANKLYFDLDAPDIQPDTLEAWAMELMDAAIKYASDTGWITASLLDPGLKPFLTSKHREGKASVHGIHPGVHFSDMRAQAAFWERFWSAKKHSGLKKRAAVKTKNKNSIGFFDKAVYGSKTSDSPLRKWYITGRALPPGMTIQDEDPTDIREKSVLVSVPPSLFGTVSNMVYVKRKREESSKSPVADEADDASRFAFELDKGQFPPCVRRFCASIAKSLGTSTACLKLVPEPNKTAQVDLWVGYPSNLGKECIHEPGKVHRNNRRQIGIRYKYYGAKAYPCWMERCYSSNHAPGKRTWVLRDVEKTCRDLPPTRDSQDALVARPNGLKKRIEKAKAAFIYAYVPILKPFRIKIKGFQDITNLTPQSDPYSAENYRTGGLPLQDVVKIEEFMEHDFSQACFKLSEKSTPENKRPKTS